MRVLLTEHDPVLADVLTDFLRDEGHTVTHAADIRQAACLARSIGWDVCILDPGGDSFFELTAGEAAGLRRLGANGPVVLTTSRAWAHRADPARLGVRAILPKPFDLGELAQILDAVARQR
jgi:DNA-binding response OmpR family regulator